MQPALAPDRLSRERALTEGLAAVILWGGSFIATKLALRQAPPMVVVWVRFGIGIPVLAFFCARRRQLALPPRGAWLRLAWLGFQGIAFHQWLQATGMVTATATVTAWIVATIPVFMALLGWLWLKERLRPIAVLGIALAAVGVLFIASQGRLEAVGERLGWGELLVLLSAPNWALFSLLSRPALERQPAAAVTMWLSVCGWLMVTLVVLAGPGLGSLATISAEGWAALAFLGVLTSGVAYVFWYDALGRLPAAQVGALIYLEPLVTMLVAASLLGEPINVASAGGGAAVLVGVWLVARARLEA